LNALIAWGSQNNVDLTPIDAIDFLGADDATV
jgi:hypothetical protein